MSQAPSHELFGHHWTLEEVRSFISECLDRDALLQTLLNWSDKWLDGRLICVVSRSDIQPFMAKGWASWGDDTETTDEMAKYPIDIASHPVLGAIIRQGRHTVGHPDELGLRAFFNKTSVLEPDELVVIPMQLAQRTKMLFLGEPHITPEDLDAFSEKIEPLVLVTQDVATQLEEIIRLAKSNLLPPQDERIPPIPERIHKARHEVADAEREARHQQAEQQALYDAAARALRANDSSMSSALTATMDGPAHTPDDEPEDAMPQGVSSARRNNASSGTPRSTLPIDLNERDTSRHTTLNSEARARAPDTARPASTLVSSPNISSTIEEDSEPSAPDVDRAATLQALPVGPNLDEAASDDAGEDEELREDSLVTGTSQTSDAAEREESPRRNTELSYPSIDEGRAPNEEEDDEDDEEDDSVAIITPIGVEDEGKKPKRTLMGGFSLEDIRKAQESFAESAEEESEETSTTLQGISSPVVSAPPSQIFKKRKTRSSSDPQDESSPPATNGAKAPPEDEDDWGSTDTLQLSQTQMKEAQDNGSAKKETRRMIAQPLDASSEPSAARNGSSVVEESAPDEQRLEENSLGRQASESHLDELFQERDSSAPKRRSREKSITEQLADITRPGEDIDAAASAPSAPEMAAPSVPSDASDDAQSAQDDVSPPAKERSEAEVLEAVDRETEEIFRALEGRDRAEAFAAAERLVASAEVIERLEESFPGRLYVDRYQWPVDSLPAPERHGPVVAAVLRIGEPCVEMLGRQCRATSLDRRFYATFLLTRLNAHPVLQELRERLYDRDQQTRNLAIDALLHQRTAPNFEDDVLAPLRREVRQPQDELHVEQAAQVLGKSRDIKALPILIEALDQHRTKIKDAIHLALQRIALQPLPAASIAWRTWYKSASEEERREWILRALNSSSDPIRELVAEEIETYERLTGVDYRPEDPPAMRMSAQKALEEWFKTYR